MREALNSNPLAQAAVVGILLLCVAVFVVSSGGGGGEEEGGEAAATGTSSVSTTAVAPTEPASPVSPGGALAAVSQSVAATAPPLPRPVMRAWKANQTPVLLFVRDGGIDDRLVKTATSGLAGFRDTAVFIVPAQQISRYAAITEGVGVDRVPALVVVTPRHLDQTVPTASVSFGFQSPQSVAQAVIDAGYKGPMIDYHP